jgi:hypothetical protein
MYCISLVINTHVAARDNHGDPLTRQVAVFVAGSRPFKAISARTADLRAAIIVRLSALLECDNCA